MRSTKKIALSAMLAALSVVMLWLGSLLQVLDISVAAIASLFVVFARVEMGKGSAVLMWIVTSVLSVILLPQGTAGWIYALFCGPWPLIKAPIERLAPWLEWILKLLIFQILFWGYFALAKFVLLLPDATTGWLLWALYAVSNLAFVLYDLALGKLIIWYGLRLRPRIARLLK